LALFGEAPTPVPEGAFRRYWSEGVGFNYRAHALSAALARAQLPRLDAFVATAQGNAQLLNDGLADLTGVTVPAVPDDRTSAFHKYRLRFDAAQLGIECASSTELRDRMLCALRAEGVGAVLWQSEPLPASPVFRRPATTWHPKRAAGALNSWDPAEHPAAAGALASSIVLGSEAAPLCVQEARLMEQYVEAIRKVVENVDKLMTAPYEPLRFA
jgi:perosamine synthetase